MEFFYFCFSISCQIDVSDVEKMKKITILLENNSKIEYFNVSNSFINNFFFGFLFVRRSRMFNWIVNSTDHKSGSSFLIVQMNWANSVMQIKNWNFMIADSYWYLVISFYTFQWYSSLLYSNCLTLAREVSSVITTKCIIEKEFFTLPFVRLLTCGLTHRSFCFPLDVLCDLFLSEFDVIFGSCWKFL